MTTTTASTGDQQQGTGQENAQQPQGGQEQPQGTPTPLDVQQAQQQAATDQEDDAQQQSGRPLGDLDPTVQRELDRARNDAARYRTEKDTAVQQAQQEADARLQAVLKAAGIDTGDGDDPEKVAEQDRTARETAEQDARDAKVELAVFRAASAPDSRADARALLDSRAFLAAIADVDPTDSDTIKEAIDKAIEDNPRLATVQAAARSSADFTGGSGDGAITQEKFDSMSNAEKNTLFKNDPAAFRRLTAGA